jgi:hypothetical protein
MVWSIDSFVIILKEKIIMKLPKVSNGFIVAMIWISVIALMIIVKVFFVK